MIPDQLADLEHSLQPGSGEDDFARRWSIVETVEADLDNDPRTSPGERETFGQLASGVSGFIRDLREGVPSPGSHRARAAAVALRSSIGKRTTGPDGWPLG